MIRLASVEDAVALDHFFGQLDRETRFMLYEAGERPSDIEGQRQRLEAMVAAPNQAMWLLVLAGEVQGFAVLIGGGLAR
ncbi:TPA: GNAT family N-acetyltransferase, partial [Aeromonas dhakensis]|nr:GNAT family N-acetyltransferase [Aeromonas dhakensis]